MSQDLVNSKQEVCAPPGRKHGENHHSDNALCLVTTGFDLWRNVLQAVTRTNYQPAYPQAKGLLGPHLGWLPGISDFLVFHGGGMNSTQELTKAGPSCRRVWYTPVEPVFGLVDRRAPDLSQARPEGQPL